jgi:hypothetical protein
MKLLISYLLFIIFIATLFACHPKLFGHTSLNKESTDSHGNLMLLGQCSRSRLEQQPFNEWFLKNYQDYSVDSLTADKLKFRLQARHFVIFMGTWCGDSKREVPRMFKILDYCGVKPSQVKLILLDNRDSVYKQSPGHEERGMNIHRVPDLIVFNDKKEMGRIVESPVVSIEKDLYAITAGEGYRPNYRAVSFLTGLFSKEMIPDIERNLMGISTQIRTFTQSPAELNTYGYVLMAAGEMDKAKIVLALNTLLYPANANVFDSFGEYYIRSGDKPRARENYQKVLQLEPGNENAKKMIREMQ